MSQIVTDENGVEHEFPDEATPEMILRALEKNSGPSVTRRMNAAGPRMTRRLATGALDAAPALGAMTLPFAMGPLGVPVGAAGGAVAQEGLGSMVPGGYTPPDPLSLQLYNTFAPQDLPSNPATRIVGNVVDQSGLALAGRGVAEVASRAAPGLMRAGMRISEGLADRFPQVGDFARAALKSGVGSRREAVAMRGASGRATRQMLRDATAQGRTVTVDEIAQDLIDLNGGAAKLSREAMRDIRAQVAEKANELFSGKGGGVVPSNRIAFTLDEAKTVAQEAQRSSRIVTTANSRGVSPSADKNLTASVGRGTTAAMRRAVPGLEAQEANTQTAIALSKAMPMEWGGHLAPRVYGGTIGAGIGSLAGHGGGVGPMLGVLAGEAVTSPPALRRAALMLNNPATLATLERFPQLSNLLLQELLRQSALSDSTAVPNPESR